MILTTAVTEAHDLYDQLVKAESIDEVASIMVGATFAAFVELDERPGQFDSKYHASNWSPWLRRLRNNPESGLLDNLVSGRN